MCGRYVLKATGQELARAFHLDEVPTWTARFNIAPLQAAPIIVGTQARVARWGLLPHWAKDASLAHKLVNARAETLADKPAFKELLATHRCVVPTNGFYEWRHEGEQHLPHWVHPAGDGLLAMAGLWSRWHSPENLVLETFTVITTRANEQLARLHDRMPLLLDEEGVRRWLSGPTHDLAGLQDLLHPWHGAPLAVTAVSSHVNSVTVDDERCLEPARTVQLQLL